MATRSLDSTVTFTQTQAADSLWLVTVYSGPTTNAAFAVTGIGNQTSAQRVASDLLAKGYHSATVSQQGA